MKKRKDQLNGLLCLQKNIRSWCTLRTWDWFKLYGKVKPLLQAGKQGEEMDKLKDKITDLEDNLKREEKLRKEVESKYSTVAEEKAALLAQLGALIQPFFTAQMI